MTLNPIDLWFLRADDQWQPLDPRHLEILPPDERQRASQFRFEKDRELYLVSRVFLRTLLSGYAAVRPRDLTFAANEWGKPRIDGPAGVDITFSLSHCAGMVSCAVARALEVGVDVESAERALDYSEIASRWLTRAERDDVDARGSGPGRRRFFTYWTLKESLSKALGLGLTVDVSRFEFRLAGSGITVSCGDDTLGDVRDWHFRLFEPTPQHILALAVRMPGEAPAVNLREMQLAEVDASAVR